MTLAHACFMLHEMGHVGLYLHRDHLCAGEWSHTQSQCPGAPHFAFSGSDVAELTTEADLRALVAAKLRASGEVIVSWGEPVRCGELSEGDLAHVAAVRRSARPHDGRPEQAPFDNRPPRAPL